MQKGQVLEYLQRAVSHLDGQGRFEGGQMFRPTQAQAIAAYDEFLNSGRLPMKERLKGYFEIPTGVGKTAIFTGLSCTAHDIARSEGQDLKTLIVVPTRDLLAQTERAIRKFAPSHTDSVGFYGDRRKDLSKPTTIMTYNAWVDLTLAGVIGSHNVDILISDEAHRGTSENRAEVIFPAYTDRTARLALTATSYFDDEKSVQATHHNLVFSKSLLEAVRGNELAAYIQPQRYIIRVSPGEFKVKFGAAANSTEFRRAVKQAAWNKRALKIFTHGYDRRTGDLLTDNQAAFFTDGIDQANKLQKMLNSSATLRQRAAANGYEHVAAAIHSGLTSKERDERWEAYYEGRLLAIIGDEQFKEGFDHEPLKSVFDYPHGSLVDKSQILGRGARKWWNEKKERWEGLTFIDTIVYIGSDDPDEDARLRSLAILGSVTARQVLEESYVVSEEFEREPYEFNLPSGGGYRGSFEIDGQNIEEYAELDDLAIFDAEKQKIADEANAPRIEYDIDDIVLSAQEHLKQSGKRPNTNDNELIKYGPLEGKTTWRAVNSNLNRGVFPPYKSLAHLLNAKYIGKKRKISSDIRADYTIVDVLEAARTHLKKHKKRPSQMSGDVILGEVKIKTTWHAINQRIPQISNHKSLSELLSEYGIGVPTLSDIFEAAVAFKEKTGKKPATFREAKVEFGSQKIKLRWRDVSDLFRSGEYQGYSTLEEFLDKSDYDFDSNGVNDNGKIIDNDRAYADYSAEDILADARAHLDICGSRPSARSEKHPIVNYRIDKTWGAINMDLYQGRIKDTYFTSLSKLFDAHDIAKHKTYGTDAALG